LAGNGSSTFCPLKSRARETKKEMCFYEKLKLGTKNNTNLLTGCLKCLLLITIQFCFSFPDTFLFIPEGSSVNMQVETNSNTSSLHDRARLFGRIPPCIDLSVTVCGAAESAAEKRWKSTNSNQNGNSFNKPLHVKTSNNVEATAAATVTVTTVKLGADGLPIGKTIG